MLTVSMSAPGFVFSLKIVFCAFPFITATTFLRPGEAVQGTHHSDIESTMTADHTTVAIPERAWIYSWPNLSKSKLKSLVIPQRARTCSSLLTLPRCQDSTLVPGSKSVTGFLERLEINGRRAAKLLQVGSTLTMSTDNISLTLQHAPVLTLSPSYSKLEYSLSSNQISVTRRNLERVVVEQNETSLSLALYSVKRSVYDSFLATPDDCLQSSVHRDPSAETVQLGSDIVVVAVSSSRPVRLTDAASLVLRHRTEEVWLRSPRCVFWDTSAHGWSDEGCRVVRSNASHTHCRCMHLTSFAIIMNVATPRDDAASTGQKVFTILFLPVSIAGLAMSLATFVYFDNLHSIRNTLHINMLSCLLVGQVLFLFGSGLTVITELCDIISVVQHFAFLSAFVWSLLEALHVYVMLLLPTKGAMSLQHKKFASTQRYTVYAIAYGIPLLIVVVSLASVGGADYSTDLYCWVNTRRGLVWAFVAPALLVIVINSLIMGLAVYVMILHSTTAQSMQARTRLSRFFLWARGVIMLIAILGTPYFVGLLHVDKNSAFFSYLFIYISGNQGGYIFVFYCLMNEKVMKEYMRKFRPVLLYLMSLKLCKMLSSVLHGSENLFVMQGLSKALSNDTLEDLLGGWEGVNFLMFDDDDEDDSEGGLDELGNPKKARSFSFFKWFLRGVSRKVAFIFDPECVAEKPKETWRTYIEDIVDTTLQAVFKDSFYEEVEPDTPAVDAVQTDGTQQAAQEELSQSESHLSIYKQAGVLDQSGQNEEESWQTHSRSHTPLISDTKPISDGLLYVKLLDFSNLIHECDTPCDYTHHILEVIDWDPEEHEPLIDPHSATDVDDTERSLQTTYSLIRSVSTSSSLNYDDSESSTSCLHLVKEDSQVQESESTTNFFQILNEDSQMHESESTTNFLQILREEDSLSSENSEVETEPASTHRAKEPFPERVGISAGVKTTGGKRLWKIESKGGMSPSESIASRGEMTSTSTPELSRTGLKLKSGLVDARSKVIELSGRVKGHRK